MGEKQHRFPSTEKGGAQEQDGRGEGFSLIALCRKQESVCVQGRSPKGDNGEGVPAGGSGQRQGGPGLGEKGALQEGKIHLLIFCPSMKVVCAHSRKYGKYRERRKAPVGELPIVPPTTKG